MLWIIFGLVTSKRALSRAGGVIKGIPVLARAAIDEISRYLDNAYKSSLWRSYRDRGFKLRGMLSTTEEGDLKVQRPDVTVRFIDRRRVLKVLLRMRQDRSGKVVSAKGK